MVAAAAWVAWAAWATTTSRVARSRDSGRTGRPVRPVFVSKPNWRRPFPKAACTMNRCKANRRNPNAEVPASRSTPRRRSRVARSTSWTCAISRRAACILWGPPRNTRTFGQVPISSWSSSARKTVWVTTPISMWPAMPPSSASTWALRASARPGSVPRSPPSTRKTAPA